MTSTETQLGLQPVKEQHNWKEPETDLIKILEETVKDKDKRNAIITLIEQGQQKLKKKAESDLQKVKRQVKVTKEEHSKEVEWLKNSKKILMEQELMKLKAQEAENERLKEKHKVLSEQKQIKIQECEDLIKLLVEKDKRRVERLKTSRATIHKYANSMNEQFTLKQMSNSLKLCKTFTNKNSVVRTLFSMFNKVRSAYDQTVERLHNTTVTLNETLTQNKDLENKYLNADYLSKQNQYKVIGLETKMKELMEELKTYRKNMRKKVNGSFTSYTSVLTPESSTGYSEDTASNCSVEHQTVIESVKEPRTSRLKNTRNPPIEATETKEATEDPINHWLLETSTSNTPLIDKMENENVGLISDSSDEDAPCTKIDTNSKMLSEGNELNVKLEPEKYPLSAKIVSSLQYSDGTASKETQPCVLVNVKSKSKQLEPFINFGSSTSTTADKTQGKVDKKVSLTHSYTSDRYIEGKTIDSKNTLFCENVDCKNELQTDEWKEKVELKKSLTVPFASSKNDDEKCTQAQNSQLELKFQEMTHAKSDVDDEDDRLSLWSVDSNDELSICQYFNSYQRCISPLNDDSSIIPFDLQTETNSVKTVNPETWESTLTTIPSFATSGESLQMVQDTPLAEEVRNSIENLMSDTEQNNTLNLKNETSESQKLNTESKDKNSALETKISKSNEKNEQMTDKTALIPTNSLVSLNDKHGQVMDKVPQNNFVKMSKACTANRPHLLYESEIIITNTREVPKTSYVVSLKQNEKAFEDNLVDAHSLGVVPLIDQPLDLSVKKTIIELHSSNTVQTHKQFSKKGEKEEVPNELERCIEENILSHQRGAEITNTNKQIGKKIETPVSDCQQLDHHTIENNQCTLVNINDTIKQTSTSKYRQQSRKPHKATEKLNERNNPSPITPQTSPRSPTGLENYNLKQNIITKQNSPGLQKQNMKRNLKEDTHLYDQSDPSRSISQTNSPELQKQNMKRNLKEDTHLYEQSDPIRSISQTNSPELQKQNMKKNLKEDTHLYEQSDPSRSISQTNSPELQKQNMKRNLKEDAHLYEQSDPCPSISQTSPRSPKRLENYNLRQNIITKQNSPELQKQNMKRNLKEDTHLYKQSDPCRSISQTSPRSPRGLEHYNLRQNIITKQNSPELQKQNMKRNLKEDVYLYEQSDPTRSISKISPRSPNGLENYNLRQNITIPNYNLSLKSPRRSTNTPYTRQNIESKGVLQPCQKISSKFNKFLAGKTQFEKSSLNFRTDSEESPHCGVRLLECAPVPVDKPLAIDIPQSMCNPTNLLKTIECKDEITQVSHCIQEAQTAKTTEQLGEVSLLEIYNDKPKTLCKATSKRKIPDNNKLSSHTMKPNQVLSKGTLTKRMITKRSLHLTRILRERKTGRSDIISNSRLATSKIEANPSNSMALEQLTEDSFTMKERDCSAETKTTQYSYSPSNKSNRVVHERNHITDSSIDSSTLSNPISGSKINSTTPAVKNSLDQNLSCNESFKTSHNTCEPGERFETPSKVFNRSQRSDTKVCPLQKKISKGSTSKTNISTLDLCPNAVHTLAIDCLDFDKNSCTEEIYFDSITKPICYDTPSIAQRIRTKPKISFDRRPSITKDEFKPKFESLNVNKTETALDANSKVCSKSQFDISKFHLTEARLKNGKIQNIKCELRNDDENSSMGEVCLVMEVDDELKEALHLSSSKLSQGIIVDNDPLESESLKMSQKCSSSDSEDALILDTDDDLVEDGNLEKISSASGSGISELTDTEKQVLGISDTSLKRKNSPNLDDQPPLQYKEPSWKRRPVTFYNEVLLPTNVDFSKCESIFPPDNTSEPLSISPNHDKTLKKTNHCIATTNGTKDQGSNSDVLVPNFYRENTNQSDEPTKLQESSAEIIPLKETLFEFPCVLERSRKTLHDYCPSGNKVVFIESPFWTAIQSFNNSFSDYQMKNEKHERKIFQVSGAKVEKAVKILNPFICNQLYSIKDIEECANKLVPFSTQAVTRGLSKVLIELAYDKSSWIHETNCRFMSTFISRRNSPQLHPRLKSIVLLLKISSEVRKKMSKDNVDYMKETLKCIERIGLESSPLDVPNIAALSIMMKVYTALARLTGAKYRVRRYIFDSLYWCQRKSIIIANAIIRTWPDVLPVQPIEQYLEHPIALAMIFALTNLPTRTHSISSPSDAFFEKHLFFMKKRYNFQADTVNSDQLISMFFSSLTYLGVEEATILLVKRAGENWFRSKHLKTLISILPMWKRNQQDDATAAAALNILGCIVRTFKQGVINEDLLPVLELSREVLTSETVSDSMKEVFVLNLCRLSKVQFENVVDIISTWKPREISSDVIDKILVGIVSRRPPKYWAKGDGAIYIKS